MVKPMYSVLSFLFKALVKYRITQLYLNNNLVSIHIYAHFVKHLAYITQSLAHLLRLLSN